MDVQPLGTSTFLINWIVFVDITWLLIQLVSLPSSFPTAFRQVSMLPPTNNVYIFLSYPCYCRCGIHAVILIYGDTKNYMLLDC